MGQAYRLITCKPTNNARATETGNQTNSIFPLWNISLLLSSLQTRCNGTGLQVNYLQANQSFPQPNKLPLSSLWNEKKTQICWAAALLYVKELQVVLQQSYRVRQQSYSETSNQTNSFSSLCSRASCIVRQSNCLQADQSSPPAKKSLQS